MTLLGNAGGCDAANPVTVTGGIIYASEESSTDYQTPSSTSPPTSEAETVFGL
jgi:hypothetical protein